MFPKKNHFFPLVFYSYIFSKPSLLTIRYIFLYTLYILTFLYVKSDVYLFTKNAIAVYDFRTSEFNDRDVYVRCAPSIIASRACACECVCACARVRPVVQACVIIVTITVCPGAYTSGEMWGSDSSMIFFLTYAQIVSPSKGHFSTFAHLSRSSV